LRFKILLNTGFQVIGKIVSSGFGFLIAILLARFYGVSDFGEYVKITAYVSAFWIMGDFGLNAIVLQKYNDVKNIQGSGQTQGSVPTNVGNGLDHSLQKNTITEKFNVLLTLRILLSLFFIFLSLSILSFIPHGYSAVSKLGIILMSFTILSQNIHLTCNSLFQHNLSYQKTLIALTMTNVVSFVFIALAIYLKASIVFVAASYSLAGFVLIISSLWMAKKYVTKITLVFDISAMKGMFLMALPLGLVLIFNVLYFHIDSFLLAVMKTNRDVGLYGYAYKFFETALVLPTFYGNSVYPVLLSRLKTDEVGFHRLFKKSIFLLFLGSIILTLVFVFVSPLLIKFSTGNRDFAGSVAALQVLSLSFPVYFVTSIFMWFYVAQNKKMFLVFVYGTSLILNFVLNLIFIPRFGYMASAWITGVSEAYILIIFIGFYKFIFLKR
jgi:O-antigen/teichoic acid export membrane protein